MSNRLLLFDVAGNPIIWAIAALALYCYVLELGLILSDRDAHWRRRAGIWLKVLPVLLSMLPLLGLLGTIVGLLATFRSMARAGGLDQQTLLSSGIANALITTQLGLITVIPGSLLCAFIRRRHRELG